MSHRPGPYVIPLLVVAGCGTPGIEAGTVQSATTYNNTRVQNTRVQNTRVQNGVTQNGAALTMAGADLTRVWTLNTPPAAGEDPNLDPSNLTAVPNVRLDKSTLVGLADFRGAVIATRYRDLEHGVDVDGYVYIDAIATTADPEIVEYTLRAYHPFVPAGADTCDGGVCPWIWEPACGTERYIPVFDTNAARAEATTAGHQLPPWWGTRATPATAIGGQWDYNSGTPGNGGKIIESTSPLYNTQVTFACTNGAIGKCVETMHYKPWTMGPQECAGFGFNRHCYQATLELAHEACVRMVRADYCGDNVDHTLEGMALDVWDNQGVNTQTPYTPNDQANGVPYGHESEWTPNGARCLSQVLMSRVAAQGSSQNVQEYLEDNSPCFGKWTNQDNEKRYKGSTFMWDDGDCFGDGPVSQHSTFNFANVPWYDNVVVFGARRFGGPAMDMHDRVYIENKSVCIDDSFSRGQYKNNHNPDKYSATWCSRCLPEQGQQSVCPPSINHL